MAFDEEEDPTLEYFDKCKSEIIRLKAELADVQTTFKEIKNTVTGAQTGGWPRPAAVVWHLAHDALKAEKKVMLSGSEALYGFVAWLTAREELTVMSMRHDAAIIVDLIAEFCKTNNLPDPRDGWEKDLVHPGKEGGS